MTTEMNNARVLTPYQQKYIAWQLYRRRSSSDDDKFTGVLSEAKVDLNPHQVNAALFAFRSPLSMGAILADEVGLGKTIEAALVISQNWAERKRHILIIASATLRKQWSIELEDKFYLPSVILEKRNFDKILAETYANPFDTSSNIVICSYSFARKNIMHISRVNWDLVVMDEAHALRNVYRNSNKTGIALKLGLQPFKKILLTATPLQNDIKELYGLISIIDPAYFGELSSFSSQYSKVALRDDSKYSELRRRILPIVHRTLRSQVQAYVKYTNRIPLVQEYYPTEDEIELSNRINRYLERDESYGLPNSQRTLITLVLYKLLASSTFAIAGTLESIIQRLEDKIKNIVSDDADTIIDDFDAIEEIEDEWIDEEDEEIEESEQDELSADDIESIKEEIVELKEIHALALRITTNSKGDCLVKALQLGFKHMEEMNAPRKALIFTESRRTQQYLYNLLEEQGYKGKMLLFNGSNSDPRSNEIYKDWFSQNKETSRVSGSKTADKRLALVDYFRDKAEIMIATEAAAEGVNLQFCSLIVNFDLPWNPQRVEQRIGRCHRYGQKYDVVVVNFINKSNRADQRVYELLDQKFNLFKGVFGASDEVLGSIGNGVDFEKRILNIYKQCRTTEDLDRAFDQLQEELHDDIKDNIQQTKASLFENFDEEVIEKLKIREEEETSRLDQYTELLWCLTCGVLRSQIKVSKNGKNEFLLPNDIDSNIHHGIYTLTKQESHGYNYRISHPLAQYVIHKAINAQTPIAGVEFDYSGCKKIVSVIKERVGTSGYLKFRLVRYHSLKEEEERILVVSTDEMGNVFNDNFTQRLLLLPAVVTEDKVLSDELTTISEVLDKREEELTEVLEARNGDLISDEIVKIENWAEDNRKALQQRLNDLDKAIEEKNDEFMKERKIRKKLAIQKEKDALNEKRDTAWREFDEKKTQLKSEKNKLVTKLYDLAEAKVETVDEYSIKWRIK
jgi:superfamily II DNA/RNA helicase